MGTSVLRSTRFGLLVAAFVTGCGAGGGARYDTMKREVDRAGALDAASAGAGAGARERAEDERALGGPALDRRAYVRAVLRRNPSIEAARQGWRAAVARVRQAGAFDDPTVSFEVAPLSIGASSARLGYSAAVSQRLPWPGKLSLDASVARAESEAMKSDFEATRRELALTATVLYDAYFVAVRSLAINAQHVALMKDLEAAATAAFETGRASAQDPLQAQAELAHLEHDAVVLASKRDITVAQMNELLHRDPALPLPPPTDDLALAASPDAASARGLERAATNRPEIAAARLRAQAEASRAERARRESYPDLTASTSYSSMWGMPEHRWMVGLSLNLPIQLGRRAGSVEEAEAARARFASDAARLTDQARTEAVVAMKRLEEATHVLRLYEARLVPIARDQVDAARAGFVAFRNDFMAVVGAEKNLRSVELAYQVARADFDRTRAELDRAVGRIPGVGDRGGDER